MQPRGSEHPWLEQYGIARQSALQCSQPSSFGTILLVLLGHPEAVGGATGGAAMSGGGLRGALPRWRTSQRRSSLRLLRLCHSAPHRYPRCQESTKMMGYFCWSCFQFSLCMYSLYQIEQWRITKGYPNYPIWVSVNQVSINSKSIYWSLDILR